MTTLNHFQKIRKQTYCLCLALLLPVLINAQTIAHWSFDEPQGLYPSHVLDDSSPNDYPLVIGKSGAIVAGKFGNALQVGEVLDIDIPDMGEVRFGLIPKQKAMGMAVAPMDWHNANFVALMCSGERHLRKEVGFKNASRTQLNIGDFDWTIEFWYQPIINTRKEALIFEIGTGPLRTACAITSLSISANRKAFILKNSEGNTEITLKTDAKKLKSVNGQWTHYAFVYNARTKALQHFVNGKPKSKKSRVQLKALAPSEEAYFTIGRNGHWKNRLGGALDELEFYAGIKYATKFEMPVSKAIQLDKNMPLKKGLPLLFANDNDAVINLGSRKHLFIDNAFIEKINDAKFVVNPSTKMERVMGDIKGSFRKHLTVVEDEEGLIRIYNSVEDDYLAVYTSKDGVHFEAPDRGITHKGKSNIVLPEMVGGLGNPFIDPQWTAFRTMEIFF